MFSEKINFDADDPVFLTGLLAGTMLATLIDDWMLAAIVAGISIAVIYVAENEDITKFMFGFAVSFILTSLAKLLRLGLFPQGINLGQLVQPTTL